MNKHEIALLIKNEMEEVKKNLGYEGPVELTNETNLEVLEFELTHNGVKKRFVITVFEGK